MNRVETARPRTSGVNRQLLRVFLLQMGFISAITVLGVYAAAKVVEGTMMRAALEGEAAHFWEMLELNPDHPLPNTDNLLGYLDVGDGVDSIPPELRSMSEGYGRAAMGNSEPLVFIQKNDEKTLFLVFDEQSVSRLSFYFGVVPLSIALVVLYISAWFAYRQSQKAVSPLVQLARTMREFDIESQSLEDLNLGDVAARPGNYESGVLIDALNGFTGEIRQLIDRERRFTRDASHELRTPLTVIQGSAEWLKMNAELDEAQDKALQRILRTVADMIELVNALLLLARGVKKGLRTETVRIRKVVDQVVSELEFSHERGRVTQTIIEDRHDAELECSPEGLYMVLSNLLRNAYNYTSGDAVRVTIAPEGVVVSNHATDIGQGDIESLFEPFVRGSDDGHSQGHGVGLDIVKRVCEHFNWSVDAQYGADKTMRFVVSF